MDERCGLGHACIMMCVSWGFYTLRESDNQQFIDAFKLTYVRSGNSNGSANQGMQNVQSTSSGFTAISLLTQSSSSSNSGAW